MTTKEALHQIVDRLPEDEPRASGIQTILEYLATLPEPQLKQLVEVVQRQRQIRGVSAALAYEDDDTRELTRLSISALRQDWDSESDSIYDDEPLR